MNEQKNGQNMPLSKQLKAEFYDDAEWTRLCEKTRYVLPAWSVLPNIDNIRIWLNRLGIRDVDYREAMQTSIQDMLRLNETWPLRAFVGLLLEFKFNS